MQVAWLSATMQEHEQCKVGAATWTAAGLENAANIKNHHSRHCLAATCSSPDVTTSSARQVLQQGELQAWKSIQTPKHHHIADTAQQPSGTCSCPDAVLTRAVLCRAVLCCHYLATDPPMCKSPCCCNQCRLHYRQLMQTTKQPQQAC